MHSQKVKEDRARKGNLFLIRSIAIVGMAIGLILLVRGWGLAQVGNNFVNEQQTIKRNPLPINTILSVSGLTIPPAGGESSTWANKITRYPGLPETVGFWLVQQKKDSTIVSEFTPDKVDTLINISRQNLNLKLFHTGQLLALNRKDNGIDELIATNPQDSKSLVQLFEFAKGQNVFTTYLVPKYQEIYFGWGDDTLEGFTISVIKPTGEVLPVYKSKAEYDLREILAVDLDKMHLDFSFLAEGHSPSICYRLNMRNNSISEIMCAAINTDGFTDGFGLVENETSGGDDIYEYNYQTLNPELIWPANVGQKRSLLTRNGNFLMWLSNEQDGSVSIQTYNLTTKAIKTYTNLPAVQPRQLWFTNGKLTILGEVGVSSYRIFLEEPAASSSSSPASAVSVTSTDTSESNTSSISSETMTSASSSSINDNGYVVEQVGDWKMYTLDGCAQNCEIEILKY